MSERVPSIRVRPEGPYLVKGADLLRMKFATNEEGRPVSWFERGEIEVDETYALCRCGASDKKPFCDGTHREVDWEPEETAELSSGPERRKEYAGNETKLTDDEDLCWHSGFCAREDTSAWKLARKGELDEHQRELLVDMARSCPSGRLQLHMPPDADADEPELKQRIGVVDDGPLVIQGAIPLESAGGQDYELRNRMSLCRCGASSNKPFCDAAHADVEFEDS